MAVKLKTIRKEEVKLDLATSISLSRHLTFFKVPSYKDVLRIESLLKILSAANEVQQKCILAFYKENNLDESEYIDNAHPMFYEFNDRIGSAITEIVKTATAIFPLKEFNAAIDGNVINFGERAFLQFWLVKEEN